MSSGASILIGAGDVGGARAISPALVELEQRGCPFAIIDHGFIAERAPITWPRAKLPQSDDAIQCVLRANYRAYVFSTSIRDALPLRVARLARQVQLRVVCVLDNWMNSRYRLEMDGADLFLPDYYAVMDEFAAEQAARDGIPSHIIRITGQPALAELSARSEGYRTDHERARILEQSGLAAGDGKLIVFISEPAEQDQGADCTSSTFRGYTEKTVLKLLAESLQPFTGQIQVGLIPHPREDHEALLATWERCRGNLQGGLLRCDSGREAVLVADAVCGMASMLLYEAFLLNKPVLSLQPNLRVEDLRFLQLKGLQPFITDERVVHDAVSRWLRNHLNATVTSCRHPELALHRNAAAALATLIQEAANATLTAGANRDAEFASND